MNPLPPLNGAGMDPNLLGALQALVQNVGAIANNVGVLARNSSGDGEHIPVVGPPDGDKRRVFCHACSMAAQTFIYPCQNSADVAAQFPGEWMQDAAETGQDSPTSQAINGALRYARACVMDTPEGSLESERYKRIIDFLTV